MISHKNVAQKLANDGKLTLGIKIFIFCTLETYLILIF